MDAEDEATSEAVKLDEEPFMEDILEWWLLLLLLLEAEAPGAVEVEMEVEELLLEDLLSPFSPLRDFLIP